MKNSKSTETETVWQQTIDNTQALTLTATAVTAELTFFFTFFW
jgi:hypothetical protein